MRRQDTSSGDLALFDLPLVVDPKIRNELDRAPDTVEQIELPAEIDESIETAAEPAAGRVSNTLLKQRLQSGALDTAIGLAALVTLVVGVSQMGVAARVADWPAYLVPTLEFSFIYVVFSITFWGRTPGMARAGLAVSSSQGDAPTPFEAARRWLGGILTLSLLGLPTLLTLRDGRSLADRLSSGRTEST